MDCVNICMLKGDWNELTKQVPVEFSTAACVKDFGASIMLQWNNIDWKKNKSARIVEQYLCEVDKREMGAEFSFLRVGEAIEDIEVWQSFETGECDRARVARKIILK